MKLGAFRLTQGFFQVLVAEKMLLINRFLPATYGVV